MIYLDSAATALLKPPEVAEAVASAINSFGNIGRGVYEASNRAGLTVLEARGSLAALFGVSSDSRVAFTANATASLNMAIDGLVSAGQHAVTTAASHNSVLRPLYRAQARGVLLSIVPISRDGALDYDAFARALEPATRLAVVTHAANVTGDVYDLRRLAQICHERQVLLVVDAAQTAGILPLDMEAMGIDVLAFTGHKGLLGPQGTGGICVREGLELPSYFVGGSGMQSFSHTHPSVMPESLEAGTLNSHGIAGLLAGLRYIERVGRQDIEERMGVLSQRFLSGVRDIKGVRVFGGGSGKRVGIVPLLVEGLDASELSAILNEEFGICTRAGVHCAPLMHEALGTAATGLTRFSFSHLNTEAEVDAALEALASIAQRLALD